MDRITYYDEKHAQVYYNASFHCVEVVWNGFASVEMYKKTLNAALHVIDKYKVKKWVSDQTNAKAVPESCEAWLRDEFLSQASKKGGIGEHYVGFIVSENIFNQMYARKISEFLEEHKMHLSFFHSKNSLYDWFENLDLAESEKIVKA